MHSRCFSLKGALSQKQRQIDLCDLHIHTTASDGQYAPQEVVHLSTSLGLRAISLCDHDTFSGYLELTKTYPMDALGVLKAGNLEIIPGVEISSQHGENELHILGYFVCTDDKELSEFLSSLRHSRFNRIWAIVDKLSSCGLPVVTERIFKTSNNASVGRPQVARAMIEQGYVSSIKEAFELYLGPGRPAYIARHYPTSEQVINIIREAQGIAVWAHPGLTGANHIIKELIEYGLQGIEVFHPKHKIEMQHDYLNMARQHGLIVTGGSDFHNSSSLGTATLGKFGVSYGSVEAMKDFVSKASY